MLILQKYTSPEFDDNDGMFADDDLSSPWQNSAGDNNGGSVFAVSNLFLDELDKWGVNSVPLPEGQAPDVLFQDALRVTRDDRANLKLFFTGDDENTSAKWMDGILAYLAFHDGFIGAQGNIVFDVSHFPQIYSYESEAEAKPRTAFEWFQKAQNWYHFLTFDQGSQNHLQQSVEFPRRVHHAFGFAFEEMGLTSVAKPHEDGSVEYTFNKLPQGGSLRIWMSLHEDEWVLNVSAKVPGKIIEFPQGVDIDGVYERIFNDVKSWHQDAGVLNSDIVVQFEKHTKALSALQSQPFKSGFAPPQADVVKFPSPDAP